MAGYFFPAPYGASERSMTTSHWGYPRPGGRSHEGQDLMLPHGTPVYAAADGVVQRVGDSGGGAGHRIYLVSDTGVTFFYAHLQPGSFQVQSGQRVTAGQVIAGVGNSGATHTDPHLHFEVHTSGGKIDPFYFLTGGMGALGTSEGGEIVGKDLGQPGMTVGKSGRQKGEDEPSAEQKMSEFVRRFFSAEEEMQARRDYHQQDKQIRQAIAKGEEAPDLPKLNPRRNLPAIAQVTLPTRPDPTALKVAGRTSAGRIQTTGMAGSFGDVAAQVAHLAKTKWGIPDHDIPHMLYLMQRESSGEVGKMNQEGSGAAGLFQMMPFNYHYMPSGRGGIGNLDEEVEAGVKYMRDRYGSFYDARKFWDTKAANSKSKRHGWW